MRLSKIGLRVRLVPCIYAKVYYQVSSLKAVKFSRDRLINLLTAILITNSNEKEFQITNTKTIVHKQATYKAYHSHDWVNLTCTFLIGKLLTNLMDHWIVSKLRKFKISFHSFQKDFIDKWGAGLEKIEIV